MGFEPIQNWEYNYHPQKETVDQACSDIARRVCNDDNELKSVLAETKKSHEQMFRHVVPWGKEYLAGNYRGSDFPQLKMRPVYIGPFRGARYDTVSRLMTGFHAELDAEFSKLKVEAKSKGWDAKKKITAFCVLLSRFFVRFLAIHPYANGNGHISRLLVFCIFIGNAIYTPFWSIPDRNINITPDELISKYRNGDKEPLLRAFFTLIEYSNPGLELAV